MNMGQLRARTREGLRAELEANHTAFTTLLASLSDADLPRVRAAIDEVFAPVLERPAIVDGLALFVEPEPGAPFMVRSWYGLGRRQQRKTA